MDPQASQYPDTDNTLTMARNPTWWTPQHLTAWERVKDAFKRDWDQTRSDLAGGGQSLNQGVGDTIQQALGTSPLPPPGVKNAISPEDVAKAVAQDARRHASMVRDATRSAERSATQAAERNLKETRLLTKAAVTDAERHVDAVKALGEARETIDAERARAEGVAQETTATVTSEYARMGEATARRSEAEARWERAEEEARYGFAARSQVPATARWDDAVEQRLRVEWEAMGQGRTWEKSKVGIRRGWDYALRADNGTAVA